MGLFQDGEKPCIGCEWYGGPFGDGPVVCARDQRVNSMPRYGCASWVRATGYDIEPVETVVVRDDPFEIPGFSTKDDDRTD